MPWRPPWYSLVPFVLGCVAGIIYIVDIALRWADIVVLPDEAMGGVSLFVVLPITTAALIWLAYVVPVLASQDDQRRFALTPRGRLRVLHTLVWSSSLYLGVCAVFCLGIDPFDRMTNGLRVYWTPLMSLGVVLFIAMLPLAAFNRLMGAKVSAWFRVTVRRMNLCFECKYDLRTRPSGACPECGWRDEENDSADEERMAAVTT